MRLRKTCCAFANSEGGFIVYGIADNRSLPTSERIMGLDINTDFPEHFGNYPRSCVPSISWKFRNPPIALNDDRVLHIVHIPRSWSSPHAVGDPEQDWQFVKRTNKGNEGMSIEEVRLGYLNFYEKRIKLQLLRSEIIVLKENAETVVKPVNGGNDFEIMLISFETRVMETVLSDVYTILVEDQSLLESLTRIRKMSMQFNNKVNFLYSQIALPRSNTESIINQHNEWIRPFCELIVSLCNQAINSLDKILNR